MIGASLIGYYKMTKKKGHVFFSQAKPGTFISSYDKFKELIVPKETAKAGQTRKDGWQIVADKIDAEVDFKYLFAVLRLILI